MVRVMVIQAEVMPEHILVATAKVAEQEMIQIRLKRVLMDLTESAAAMKMALSIQLVPYMAEERVKGIQPAILANLLGNEMPEVVVQTEI